MAAASHLAARTRPLARPNPGVGALIVENNRIIARGWTQAGGRPHAEKHALDSLGQRTAEGAVMYITLEPCAHQSLRGPACCDVIVASAPARVVIGQIDPDPRTTNKGVTALKAAGIETSVLHDEPSARSLAGFFASQNLGRPFVTLKLAMSLDGCIALADGTSQWITGEAARAHVHAVRAKQDAILVGGGTWRTDKPRLDVRLAGLASRSPDKIVLTSSPVPEGVTALPSPESISDLEDTHYLYVEGGAQTAASFLKADLVDELHIYRAPILIGDGLRAMGPLGLTDLAGAHDRWRLDATRTLGSDTFEAYLRVRT
ncbi:MAG: bifunctional diaminohydroxyphosphoribosylaminopyrimidine deaminase/5-amino-6-(5-phosphoribosylamino)uracil reductase RibD [Pseudomonadota bacterium]